ncbi:MAG: NUDIX domain-containing protein [bacterium]|nr:NUDIX domain-containing protein [bacterium]
MIKAWTLLGGLIFWLAWPFWWMYFKRSPNRTRVIITDNTGRVLLVKGWLGDSSWGLPGGGVKRGESIKASACREIKEETGIEINQSDLITVGDIKHSEHGLTYQAHFLKISLINAAEPTRSGIEIVSCDWFNDQQLKTTKLNKDARYGLENFLNDRRVKLA